MVPADSVNPVSNRSNQTALLTFRNPVPGSQCTSIAAPMTAEVRSSRLSSRICVIGAICAEVT